VAMGASAAIRVKARRAAATAASPRSTDPHCRVAKTTARRSTPRANAAGAPTVVVPGDGVLVIRGACSSGSEDSEAIEKLRAKIGLTKRPAPAPPSPARVSPKSVVHSDNRTVTWRLAGTPRGHVATLFHAQAVDFVGFRTDGTFFTKVEVIRIFCRERCAGIAPCTDLSTDRVDKGESRYAAVTCTTYRIEAERLSGKPMVRLQAASHDAFMHVASAA
ncbi:hypothetical protein, partial [Lysobacter dokdonensis]|uniref:hypothetical protein n=1 Tax=Noviluteimonas dokdonensis TaxID=414050 RepID=UPI0013766DB3